jgi:hypothetical protein
MGRRSGGLKLAALRPASFHPLAPHALSAEQPTIDFTQHEMEDGTIVSTQERVVKDVRVASPFCRGD